MSLSLLWSYTSATAQGLFRSGFRHRSEPYQNHSHISTVSSVKFPCPEMFLMFSISLAQMELLDPFYSKDSFKCSHNPKTALVWQNHIHLEVSSFLCPKFSVGTRCSAHLSREQAQCQAGSSSQAQEWGQGRARSLRNSMPKCHQQPQQQSSWKT